MAEHLAGSTDTGRSRENNEDTFVAKQSKDGRFVLAVVIDGVGGYNGGEVAAARAKEELTALLPKITSANGSLLKDAFIAANEKIFASKSSGPFQNMACVLTAVIIDREKNHAAFAHIGDTRLYLFRDGSLVKLTQDHSFVGLLEDTGRITEEEAIHHPKRNEINKALGFEQNIIDSYIETGETPFLPGDLLLLCSDGLTDMISNKEIRQIIDTSADLDEAAAQLINAANEAGGRDNITVVLVRNHKERSHQEPIKGQFTEPARTIDTAPSKEPKSQVVKKEKEPVKSARRPLIPILVFMVILIALALIFFNRGDDPAEEVAEPLLPHLLLSDTLANAADTIFLDPTLFGDTIPLQRTVWLQQDSLLIAGNALTVILNTEDSIVLQVAPSSAFLKFADLELNNLRIDISGSRQEVLQFSNVRFKNVRIGVGEPLVIADTLFSGSFSDLIKLNQ